MNVYLVVFICSMALAPGECNTRTARAFHASTQPGSVCGLPAQVVFAETVIQPGKDEYIKTSCRTGR
jgi:hypothetical protein